MPDTIFKNWYTISFNDKKIEKSYEDFRKKIFYKFHKFLIIFLLIQSLFVCIITMTNLELYHEYREVKLSTISSFIITFLLIIFFILDLRRIPVKYLDLFHNIEYLFFGIVNCSLRIVFAKYLKVNYTYDSYLYIFEILFRFLWLILAFQKFLQCVLMNLITIFFAWVFVLLTNSSDRPLLISNTTFYTFGFIFTQIIQYLFEKNNKQTFYCNALSKKNSDWLTRVFEKINTGFLSIHSGKISSINSFLKNLLPKVKKDQETNYNRSRYNFNF